MQDTANLQQYFQKSVNDQIENHSKSLNGNFGDIRKKSSVMQGEYSEDLMECADGQSEFTLNDSFQINLQKVQHDGKPFQEF
mmetsp:Transcript_549/g.592  ORF Transcript_549/g.592 Transcript_549/m.592 type:complete len:82 (+) Transcript_549:839-1084(+)